MASDRDQFVESKGSGRAAGYMLAAGSILSFVFMWFHPATHAHTPAKFVEAVSAIAAADRIVHGSLIALSGVLFVGFWGVANRLGLNSVFVRSGLVAYAMGMAAMAVAALTNGLVLPEYVVRYEDPSAADLETMRHVFRMSHAVNQTFAQVGMLAISGATCLWSVVMAQRSGPIRTVGIIGVLAALLPSAALVAGHLRMDVYGMLAFVLAQSVWGLGVASLLIRGRL
jgi:hypothetical protein